MKKKILSISALCLFGVLVVALLVLAILPYSNFPEISNPANMSIHTDSSIRNFTEENENYSEYMSLLKSSFSENYLTALFTGKLKKNDVQPASSFSKSGNYIRFTYNSNQTLMNKCKKVNKLSSSTEFIEYNELYFAVGGENEINSVVVYYNDTNDSSNWYSISYWGNLYEVYNKMIAND